MEDFNGILFHKSGPANDQPTNHSHFSSILSSERIKQPISAFNAN
jgi:hypothetical protein